MKEKTKKETFELLEELRNLTSDFKTMSSEKERVIIRLRLADLFFTCPQKYAYLIYGQIKDFEIREEIFERKLKQRRFVFKRKKRKLKNK